MKKYQKQMAILGGGVVLVTSYSPVFAVDTANPTPALITPETNSSSQPIESLQSDEASPVTTDQQQVEAENTLDPDSGTPSAPVVNENIEAPSSDSAHSQDTETSTDATPTPDSKPSNELAPTTEPVPTLESEPTTKPVPTSEPAETTEPQPTLEPVPTTDPDPTTGDPTTAQPAPTNVPPSNNPAPTSAPVPAPAQPDISTSQPEKKSQPNVQEHLTPFVPQPNDGVPQSNRHSSLWSYSATPQPQQSHSSSSTSKEPGPALEEFTGGSQRPITEKVASTPEWVENFLNQEKKQTADGAVNSTGVTGTNAQASGSGAFSTAGIGRLSQTIISGQAPLFIFSIAGLGVILYVTRRFMKDSGNGKGI